MGKLNKCHSPWDLHLLGLEGEANKKKVKLSVYIGFSPAVEGRDPKVPVKVFFSLDYLSMRSNESFQGGCETLTLEHSEKSKMAAKMAAKTKNHHNFTSI